MCVSNRGLLFGPSKLKLATLLKLDNANSDKVC